MKDFPIDFLDNYKMGQIFVKCGLVCPKIMQMGQTPFKRLPVCLKIMQTGQTFSKTRLVCPNSI